METECAICRDRMDTDHISDLPCGHTFHRACIDEWFAQSPRRTCPTCRFEMTVSNSGDETEDDASFPVLNNAEMTQRINQLQERIDVHDVQMTQLNARIDATAAQIEDFNSRLDRVEEARDRLGSENDRLRAENARLERMVAYLRQALQLGQRKTTSRLPVPMRRTTLATAAAAAGPTAATASSYGGNRRRSPNTAQSGYAIAFGTTRRRNNPNDQGKGRAEKTQKK